MSQVEEAGEWGRVRGQRVKGEPKSLTFSLVFFLIFQSRYSFYFLPRGLRSLEVAVWPNGGVEGGF